MLASPTTRQSAFSYAGQQVCVIRTSINWRVNKVLIILHVPRDPALRKVHKPIEGVFGEFPCAHPTEAARGQNVVERVTD